MKKIIIPTTIEETIQILDEELSDKDKKFLLDQSLSFGAKRAAGLAHRGLGLWIRNNWELWGPTEGLKKLLRDEYEIIHPDDMSNHIIVNYCNYLLSKHSEK